MTTMDGSVPGSSEREGRSGSLSDPVENQRGIGSRRRKVHTGSGPTLERARGTTMTFTGVPCLLRKEGLLDTRPAGESWGLPDAKDCPNIEKA
jgi:hypothetical protein